MLSLADPVKKIAVKAENLPGRLDESAVAFGQTYLAEATKDALDSILIFGAEEIAQVVDVVRRASRD